MLSFTVVPNWEWVSAMRLRQVTPPLNIIEPQVSRCKTNVVMCHIRVLCDSKVKPEVEKLVDIRWEETQIAIIFLEQSVGIFRNHVVNGHGERLLHIAHDDW